VNFPLAKGKYSKPARTLARILGFMGLAVWLFYFYIWYQYLIGRQMTFVFEMMSPAFFAANCCFVFRHTSSPMQTKAVGATFVLFLAVDPPKTFL